MKYYENQRKANFTSKVLELDENTVVLDHTYFYPEGGGQPSDIGMIGNVVVNNVQKTQDGKIIHYIQKGANFHVGEEVECLVNWEYRFDYMQQHTGQHLISAVAFREFGIETVSVHLGDSYISVEFIKKDISEDVIKGIEKKCNELIQENRKIIVNEYDKEEAKEIPLRRSIKVNKNIRIVTIENYDSVACGGIHVDNLSELLMIKFLKKEFIRGNTKLFWKVGNRCLKHYDELLNISNILSKKFSCSFEEITERISKQEQDYLLLKKENKELSEKLIDLYVNYLKSDRINGKKYYFHVFDSFGSKNMTQLCKELKGNCLLIDKNNNRNFWFIKTELNISNIFSELLNCLGGKGGGNKGFYQGITTQENFEECYKKFISLTQNLEGR